MLWLALGCTPPTQAPTAALALERCHLTGLDSETLCGTWTVPENRESPDRTIELRVVVVPPVSPDPAPDPLFFLAGGPGQAASEVAASVFPLFERVQKDRALVFVDQRGTGQSNPLACDDEASTFADRADIEVDVAGLRACRDALDADLTRYTTSVAMRDLDAVREALGVEQINLYGGSYGTRAGLEYMRQFPDRVRTATLDGLAPTSMELFLHFAPDGQAALDATFRDCAAEPACAGAFPTLRADFDAVTASLPREVAIADPVTGVVQPVTLTPQAWANGVRTMLYAPDLTALLPLTIASANRGDFGPFAAQTSSMTDSMKLYAGMMLSVTCSEDLPRITDAALAERSAGSFLGDRLVHQMREACAEWPTTSVDAAYYEPVTADVPTLLLSGALDPVTPPRWADEVDASLPDSVHLVAPGAGHNVIPLGCGPRLVAGFVESGATADVDGACIEAIERPAFFVDFAGPG